MKRIAILCAALLSLLLLAGCRITPLKDTNFQEEWSKSMDELEEDAGDTEDSEDDNAWTAWADEWEDWSKDSAERFSGAGDKTHRWKILDAGGQELAVISDEEALQTLDDLLLCGDDSWDHLAKEPGTPAYIYVYNQEETVKAGQNPGEERQYEDLLTFTVSADKDVVTVQILGGLEEMSLLPGVALGDILTFHVSVPEDTVEALRNPEQFSQ